jgi:hypothetical protein
MSDDIPTQTLAETEDYVAWMSEEPDGEQVYHIELGTITLHFFREEWQQLLKLLKEAGKKNP